MHMTNISITTLSLQRKKKKSYPCLTWTKLDWAVPFVKGGITGSGKNCRCETGKRMDLGLSDIICARFKKKAKSLKEKGFEHGSTKAHVMASNM